LEVIKASQRTVFERLGTKSRGRRWRKSDGPSISSTSIGASMKLLIDAGVISMFGADVELVDQEFAPGSEKWGRVEELRGQRKGVAEDALRRITDYAEGEASQERLIELLG